jgi:hypothetical protein
MRHDLAYSVTALADLEAILLPVAGDAAIRSTLSHPMTAAPS